MFVGARKNPVQPGQIPLGAVKEYRRHPCPLGRNHIRGGVSHVPDAGWLNFRMRAMLMAVASYRCLTERQATAEIIVANKMGQTRLQAL